MGKYKCPIEVDSAAAGLRRYVRTYARDENSLGLSVQLLQPQPTKTRMGAEGARKYFLIART